MSTRWTVLACHRLPAVGRCVRPAGRAGMTMLELMLALSLTAIVLVVISMAIDMHLRVLPSRRGHVERIQLSRAVLTIIATDLRATVQQSQTDFSALASMATEAAASAAATEATGGTGTDGGAGDSTGGADTGGSSTGGGASTGTGGTSSGTDEDAASASDTTGQTENIAASGTVPPVPGLYGNQYELQIDVSRLPRVDEFQRMTAETGLVSLHDIPSDVKTVAYYCVSADAATSTGVMNRRTGRSESGLVRRVMDRAVTLYASENGNLQGLQQVAEVIAPEVQAIEFQYFDGTQWLTEWDSEEQAGLPAAVRITLMLTPDTTLEDVPDPARRTTVGTTMATQQLYSLTVRLPTAQPATSDTTTDSSGMEAVGL